MRSFIIATMLTFATNGHKGELSSHVRAYRGL